MEIELLVFEGCPNQEPTERLLRQTISELKISTEVKVVTVNDNDEAIVKRFLGSPSIRIDGRDIEIEEGKGTQYAMRCRVYSTERGYNGVPPKQLILDALFRETKTSLDTWPETGIHTSQTNRSSKRTISKRSSGY